MKIKRPLKYEFDGHNLKMLIELTAKSKMMKVKDYRTYICRCFNISRPRLSLYEKGKAMPGIDQLFWFTEHFNLKSINTLVKPK